MYETQAFPGRPVVFRCERSINPVLLQERKEVGGLLKIHVFDEKGIGAQLVGAGHVWREYRPDQTLAF